MAQKWYPVVDILTCGGTLRMLQLPSAWSNFISESTHGASCLGQLSGLGGKKAIYKEAVETLANGKMTTLVLVTRPEEAPLKEAQRASRELAELTEINEKLTTLHSELEVVAELIQRHISANAQVAMNQAEYNRQFNEYEARSESIKESIATLENQRATLSAKLGAIRQYTETLRNENRIAAFDERLWYCTVEQVRVKPDGIIRFEFRGGKTIEG